MGACSIVFPAGLAVSQILLIGAILAPGKRTITSILRVMGLREETHFQNYHRVLSRAQWSPLAASRRLLALLLQTFVPTGPLIMGIKVELRELNIFRF